MLPFPNIDPVAISFAVPYVGTLAIRWYSLAYIGGIVLGWYVFKAEHAKKPIAGLKKEALEDMVVWAVLGIILGGRLGHVLFYAPDYYLKHPLEALYIWQGGMSFHGGTLGFAAAFYLFCCKNRVSFWAVMDVLACCVPIGLGLGRLANFINGELYGRVTDSPLGMVFPNGGDLPRYPSQLYEFLTEGVVMFIVLMVALKRTSARDKPGFLAGLFMVLYSFARGSAEYFREPEGMVGFLTYGQFLTLPMLFGGLYLMVRRTRDAR